MPFSYRCLNFFFSDFWCCLFCAVLTRTTNRWQKRLKRRTAQKKRNKRPPHRECFAYSRLLPRAAPFPTRKTRRKSNRAVQKSIVDIMSSRPSITQKYKKIEKPVGEGTYGVSSSNAQPRGFFSTRQAPHALRLFDLFTDLSLLLRKDRLLST